MNTIRITTTLTKVHIKETLLSAATYIALSISGAIGYFSVRGFITSIDSQGFNPSLSPLLLNITTAMEGLFSSVAVETLFSQGPFLFALYCCFIPMLLYICSSSIMTDELHHEVGAVELLRFGAADGKSYQASLFLRDLVMILVSLIFFVILFSVIALMNNMILGPAFWRTVLILPIISILVCAYARLCAASTSGIGALFLFYGVMVLFALVHVGSFTVVHAYIRNVSNILSWIIRWVSPFFYYSFIQQVIEIGSLGTAAVGVAAALAVSAAVGFLALQRETRKGVQS